MLKKIINSAENHVFDGAVVNITVLDFEFENENAYDDFV